MTTSPSDALATALLAPTLDDFAKADDDPEYCPIGISHRHDIDWSGQFGRCSGCGKLHRRTLASPPRDTRHCPYCGEPVSHGGLCTDCAYDVACERADTSPFTARIAR